MIATHNQQAPKDNLSFNLHAETLSETITDTDLAISNIKSIATPSSLLLPSRIIVHNPKAGLNPLADAAAYLISVLGKLKALKSYRQLGKLQKELIEEINAFQEAIAHHGYNAEYLIVCRYVLCATFDDVISHTIWGCQGQWDCYGLLANFNQDTQQDKFFTIMERAVKEPAHYIDLMELMYICLSMGYKGQYRSTEHSQFQLEQITNNLYKHIRAYRGNFSKNLSPTPLKLFKTVVKTSTKGGFSPLFILFTTACIVMGIFVSLGYLMDVISNDAYKNVAQVQYPVSVETTA